MTLSSFPLQAKITPHIQAAGLTIESTSFAKGMARSIRIKGHSAWAKDVEVDFVGPALKSTHPGVDSCAGNVCIQRKGTLQLKVSRLDPVVSLRDSIEHCERKAFVFFYAASFGTIGSDERGRCMTRLKKYLDRGWTCISPLAQDVLQQLSVTQRELCKPEDKYGDLNQKLAGL